MDRAVKWFVQMELTDTIAPRDVIAKTLHHVTLRRDHVTARRDILVKCVTKCVQRVHTANAVRKNVNVVLRRVIT